MTHEDEAAHREPDREAREFAERAAGLLRAGPDEATVPMALVSIALSLSRPAEREAAHRDSPTLRIDEILRDMDGAEIEAERDGVGFVPWRELPPSDLGAEIERRLGRRPIASRDGEGLRAALRNLVKSKPATVYDEGWNDALDYATQMIADALRVYGVARLAAPSAPSSGDLPESGPGFARFTATDTPEDVERKMADAFAPLRAARLASQP